MRRLDANIIHLADARCVGQVIPHSRYDVGQMALFVGARGYGKTTALRAYLDTREPRVLAFDLFGDFRELDLAEDLDAALDELGDRGFWGTGDLKPARVRVQPAADSTHEYGEQAFEAIWARLRNCLLVLDEITLWTTPTQGARDTKSPLTKVVLQGRRIGIRIAAGVQQLSLFPHLLRSNLTHLVIFHTVAPSDLDRLREWAGDQVASKARTLDIGECIVVTL